MLSLYLMELKYEVHTNINLIFHLLRKLKIFNSIIPEESNFIGIKETLTGISVVFKIVKSIFFGILYAGIVYFITTIYSKFVGLDANRTNILMSTLFMLYVIINSMHSSILGESEKILLFHEVFRQPAKDLARIELLIGPLTTTLGRLAGFTTIFTLLLGVPFTEVLVCTLVILTITMIADWVHLKLFDRGISLQDNVPYTVIVILGAMALAIVIMVTRFDLTFLFRSPFTVIVSIGLLGSAYFANWNYKNYNMIAKQAKNVYEKQMEMKAGSFRTKDVELKESDLVNGDKATKENAKAAKLQGYAKLNYLFFSRHRRILLKQLLIMGGIVLVVAAIGSIGLIYNKFNPILDGKTMEIIFDFIKGIIPYYMYVSMGTERLAKSMFVNCDSSLLTYSFYRRPADILESYNHRLKEIVKLNLPPTVAALVLVLSWLFLSGIPVTSDRLLLILLIITLYAFFTIHQLFIYYIFQPYNNDVKIKSPIYSIINVVVYTICYFPLIMKPPMTVYTIVAILLTVIYAVVSRILIPKMAPRTFRLK